MTAASPDPSPDPFIPQAPPEYPATPMPPEQPSPPPPVVDPPRPDEDHPGSVPPEIPPV